MEIKTSIRFLRSVRFIPSQNYSWDKDNCVVRFIHDLCISIRQDYWIIRIAVYPSVPNVQKSLSLTPPRIITRRKLLNKNNFVISVFDSSETLIMDIQSDYPDERNVVLLFAAKENGAIEENVLNLVIGEMYPEDLIFLNPYLSGAICIPCMGEFVHLTGDDAFFEKVSSLSCNILNKSFVNPMKWDEGHTQ